jgi:hypothetical protein
MHTSVEPALSGGEVSSKEKKVLSALRISKVKSGVEEKGGGEKWMMFFCEVEARGGNSDLDLVLG